MYSTTQVAKMCNLKSANELNKILERFGIQESFYYNNRKYWKLTEAYRNKGYEGYDGTYADRVSRPMLLATMRWTEQGVQLIRKLLDTADQWYQYLSLPPVNALHLYTNQAGHQVVQLTSYNPSEPLDGTRAYIPEATRRQFVQEVENSAYRKSKLRWNYLRGVKFPTYAVDDNDEELFQKWANWIKLYDHYSKLLEVV